MGSLVLSPSITYVGVHLAVAMVVSMLMAHMWLMGVGLERFIQHLVGSWITCVLALGLAFADVAVLKAEREIKPGNAVSVLVSATTTKVCWALLVAALVLLAIHAARGEALRTTCYAFVASIALGLTARAMQLHTLNNGWAGIHNLAYAISVFALCLPISVIGSRLWQAKEARAHW